MMFNTWLYSADNLDICNFLGGKPADMLELSQTLKTTVKSVLTLIADIDFMQYYLSVTKHAAKKNGREIELAH